MPDFDPKKELDPEMKRRLQEEIQSMEAFPSEMLEAPSLSTELAEILVSRLNGVSVQIPVDLCRRTEDGAPSMTLLDESHPGLDILMTLSFD
ncbi:hypothetical protein OAO01_06700 [Oligoflexia bacterium]|nr:hypothetical protein [Oligoflexia bacterium]